jgi:hypothetical protein
MREPPDPFNRGPRRLRWLGWASLVLAVVAVGGWVLTRPHSQPKALALPVVARANLVFCEGRWFQLPKTNLFTGWMVAFYPDGALCSRSAVSNGLLNGVSEGWYTNGQVQIRECYKDSLADGLRQKWYENGQLKSEAMIAQGKLEGTFRSWHENGRLAEEIEMKQGKPEGEAWAFYSSGFLKAETKVSAGKVLARKFWEDGERQLASATRGDAVNRSVPRGRSP